MPDWAPDGRLLAANPALAKMLRYDSPGEMLAAISDVARQVLADPCDLGQELDFVGGVECQFKCKDGQLVSGVRDAPER